MNVFPYQVAQLLKSSIPNTYEVGMSQVQAYEYRSDQYEVFKNCYGIQSEKLSTRIIKLDRERHKGRGSAPTTL